MSNDTIDELQALTKILQIIKQDLDRERRSKQGLDTLANAMQHSASLKNDDSHKNIYEKLQHVCSVRNTFWTHWSSPYSDGSVTSSYSSESLKFSIPDFPYGAVRVLYNVTRLNELINITCYVI